VSLSNGGGPATNKDLQDLIDDLVSMPSAWIAFITVLVVISLFDVTLSEEACTVNIRVTSTTVVLVGLTWLPALLRMLALLGGGVKAGGNEARVTGLLSILDDNLGALSYLQRNASEEDVESLNVDEIVRKVEEALSNTVPDREDARSKLHELAKEYEQIRGERASSPERTTRLEKVVAQVRAFARKADLGVTELRKRFEGESTGDRVVALGVLQRCPDASLFDLVLSALRNSKSAFEQYHALRAAQSMIDRLSADQSKELQSFLEERLSDSTSYIAQSPDRKAVAKQMLEVFRGERV
jgi:hypothetical protein